MGRSAGAYRSDKRSKELARRKKQEEKRKRRLERASSAAQAPMTQDARPVLSDDQRSTSSGDPIGGASGSV